MKIHNLRWTGATYVLLGLLAYLLYWRWQVGITRFFDVDEFSYLHWTAQVARGELPYVDFFSYFTPGFMWAYAPLFWIWGQTTQLFIAARVAAFGIFLGILGSLGVLYGKTRGWRWALLPVVILAFLPMPYDKFLEVRPDNLATLLALVGVIGQIQAMKEKKTAWWVASGLAYSASLLVLVKTLPIVLVGAIVATLSKNAKGMIHFFIGICAPWMMFFLGWALLGHFQEAWYALTTLVFEVSEAAINFSMEPNLFFYPNASFYGGNGYGITQGLVVNHAVWIFAIFVGAYRLLMPFAAGDRTHILSELLVSGAFFVSIFFYVKFFPLKHSQYLIPIAVFVAYYAADGISVGLDWLTRIAGSGISLALLVALGYGLMAVTRDVNTPKLAYTNTVQLTQLTQLKDMIPPTVRVVDMEGRMLFWPEGYPICCLPFDVSMPYVTFPPPPLAAYLAAHPAQYIWEGDSGRIANLSAANREYVLANFAQVPGWEGKLWKRKQ